MSWILYRVDRVGRDARDPGVIVCVRRLGAGYQRCFNPLPCTAAINPAYPPSRARSHTLRILLITQKLSCRRFTPRRSANHIYTSLSEYVRPCCRNISDPEK